MDGDFLVLLVDLDFIEVFGEGEDQEGLFADAIVKGRGELGWGGREEGVAFAVQGVVVVRGH